MVDSFAMERYPLAPMSGLILWLTIVVLPLPLLLLYAGTRIDLPYGWIPALLVALIYLFVWLYMRPTRFEISRSSLDIVWPLRRDSTPLADIDYVELLSGDEFRERYGFGVRIGAGGLWGGFGLFKTRSQTFRFYVSRLDRKVLIWRHSDIPLLITPAEPERFIRSLLIACS